MFKDVKKKLTLLYTFSLLFLLILFITTLYFFISHEIESKEQEELRHYLDKERGDLLDDDYEHGENHELEFDPDKKIFFYVYTDSNKLLSGEEIIAGLSSKIKKINEEEKDSPSLVITDKWQDTHYMVMKESLQLKHDLNANVYIGMDITNEKHLIQNITWLLIALTILFSILFGFLGYYLAGQAMKPIRQAFETQKKFVSDASHELRTPLSIFYSSIDLLMREEKNNLSPFGQEVLHDVKSETEMMNKLINDLLFLARSDNRHFHIETEEMNLSLLLQSLCRKISLTVPPHIDFKEQIQEDIHFLGDEVRIHQLIYILLDNAFRYTVQGHVILALKKQADSIIITIEDSGNGIHKNDLPHIFDRFYRGDTSRVRDGSGLGLSIAKSIVLAHGGNITVKSELGVGTIFTIVFNTTNLK
ncbi:MAG: Signal transduction histidine-protein kinase arlS [Bacillus sp. (in: firmicutes)]|nr:Signal transduction histidine-protein kinase arlS [Bacillus sp. (in: firmicutes)]